MRNKPTLLLGMYQAMLDALGPSHWWPGESRFEVVVGAVLTQNTNWVNVEKALSNLRDHGMLDPHRMFSLSLDELADYIRPSGAFRVKAVRMRAMLEFLHDECAFDLEQLMSMDMDDLRQKLLDVKGVGPETADSILLYALDYPAFVVDAYTRRILNRHLLVPEDVHYDELQEVFTDVLDRDVALFNEFHALLVRVAKQWCLKKKAACETCPLVDFLE